MKTGQYFSMYGNFDDGDDNSDFRYLFSSEVRTKASEWDIIEGTIEKPDSLKEPEEPEEEVLEEP